MSFTARRGGGWPPWWVRFSVGRRCEGWPYGGTEEGGRWPPAGVAGGCVSVLKHVLTAEYLWRCKKIYEFQKTTYDAKQRWSTREKSSKKLRGDALRVGKMARRGETIIFYEASRIVINKACAQLWPSYAMVFSNMISILPRYSQVQKSPRCQLTQLWMTPQSKKKCL